MTREYRITYTDRKGGKVKTHIGNEYKVDAFKRNRDYKVLNVELIAEYERKMVGGLAEGDGRKEKWGNDGEWY